MCRLPVVEVVALQERGLFDRFGRMRILRPAFGRVLLRFVFLLFVAYINQQLYRRRGCAGFSSLMGSPSRNVGSVDQFGRPPFLRRAFGWVRLRLVFSMFVAPIRQLDADYSVESDVLASCC
jgi:hypothetical protein